MRKRKRRAAAAVRRRTEVGTVMRLEEEINSHGIDWKEIDVHAHAG